MERKYDIEDQCVAFGAAIVKFTDNLPNTMAPNHPGGQLLRSGTAAALHHGEVQGAESPRDLRHKMRSALNPDHAAGFVGRVEITMAARVSPGRNSTSYCAKGKTGEAYAVAVISGRSRNPAAYSGLTELRESRNNMKVQALAGLMDLTKPDQRWLMQECGELIAIFTASNKTLEKSHPDKKWPRHAH